jgi:hypothetical protein
VDEVQMRDRPAGIAAFGLDRPAPGEANDRTYILELRGWVIGGERPVRSVEVMLGGQVLHSAPADVERPDVEARRERLGGSGGGGFFALVGTPQLPLEFKLDVVAELEGGERSELATLRGSRAPVRSGFEPRLLPLMLTSHGRSGSTILMRLLEGHPELVAYPPFEHEPRVATYWLEVFLALASPPSYLGQITHPGHTADDWWLGRRPPFPRRVSDPELQDWLGREAVESLAALCQGRIEAVYERIAGEAAEVRYFAEKFNPNRTPQLAWELYGERARELMLVRDPRDVACSILATMEKRGERELPSDRARYIGETVKGRLGAAAHAWRLRSDKAHLVRYEDLVRDPRSVLEPMLAYLGIDASPAAVERMVAHAFEPIDAMGRHRTTPDPEASIGRWRRETEPEVRAVCETAFEDELELFGYVG